MSADISEQTKGDVLVNSRKEPLEATEEEWERLPKAKGRLHGLSRTTWVELIDAGHVKSVVIRKGEALRGIRLISLTSYREYLRRLEKQQAKDK